MRLIDADALKKCARVVFDKDLGRLRVVDVSDIDNAPTVDNTCPHCDSGYAQGYSDGYLKGKEDRPHGEWEYVQYDGNPNIGNWHCSECRHIVSGKYNQKPSCNFCSRCGAKMKGGAE